MTELAIRSIVVERVMPHPPEKIWRALTEAQLIGEWLMKNDFKPVVSHKFNFRSKPMPYWNGITDCEVVTVQPHERLAYRWNSSGEEAANGLNTVVTWTLTPVAGGTRVRMEQSGFQPKDSFAYEGASGGWPRIVEGLERVAGGLD